MSGSICNGWTFLALLCARNGSQNPRFCPAPEQLHHGFSILQNQISQPYVSSELWKSGTSQNCKAGATAPNIHPVIKNQECFKFLRGWWQNMFVVWFSFSDFWCLIHDAFLVVHGSWRMSHWCSIHDDFWVVHGSWLEAHQSWLLGICFDKAVYVFGKQ